MPIARLHLHDRRQHRRTARRHADRRLVHRHDHRLVADLARAALDGDPHRGRRLRRGGRAVHQRSRRAAGSSASSPAGRTPACPPSTRASWRKRGVHTTCPTDERVLFLEVQPGDASDFSDVLHVRASTSAGFACSGARVPPIPNAIAGLLLDLRDRTGVIPHAYFGWTEGNPDRLPAEVPGVRRRATRRLSRARCYARPKPTRSGGRESMSDR